MRILLPLVHLLLECLRLLLICEGQTGETVLEFEGVEKCPVLIVCEGVIYLLVPDHTSLCRLFAACQYFRCLIFAESTHRYVYHLDPICVSDQVVGEHSGTL